MGRLSPERVGTAHSHSEDAHSGSPSSALPCMDPVLSLGPLQPYPSCLQVASSDWALYPLNLMQVIPSQAGFSVPASAVMSQPRPWAAWRKDLNTFQAVCPGGQRLHASEIPDSVLRDGA